jgi:hypothetical protein
MFFFFKSFIYIEYLLSKSLSDETKKAALKGALPLIYDAVDSNKDGSISKEEFSNYFKSLNINDTQAAFDAFKAMDVNNDDSLSKEGKLNLKNNSTLLILLLYLEFITFGRDFFLSIDEKNPSKYFFGPLA